MTAALQTAALVLSMAVGWLVFRWVEAREWGGDASSSPFSKVPWRAWGASWRERWSARRRLDSMRRLFPQSVGMAVQALKAGQTLPQTLDYLSQECPEPLREEWRKVCGEMDMGSSAEAALQRLGERYPAFTDFHQFLQSYRISRQTGANLTHLLGVLLEGMETRDRLTRKMEAMTAQARLSAWLMGLLPVVLLLVFFLMDPTLLAPLVTRQAGWGILALALVLETLGFLWIRQLLRVQF